MSDFIAISSETNFEDTVDHLIDLKKIKWFSVKANLFETEQEINEKKQAMLRQYNLGIIQANGLPVGVTLEQVGLSQPNNAAQRPVNSFDMKIRREQELAAQRARERLMRQSKLHGIQNKDVAKKFGL